MKKPKRKRKVSFEKKFVSFVTFFSLIYKIFESIENRRLVVKALQDPETYKTVLVTEKKTENL